MRVPVLALLALLGVSAPLAACSGFQPLYAMNNDITPALRSVDIVVPTGRAGYLLREQINDELARDFSQPARFRLVVTLTEDRIPRGIRINNVAAEIELDLRATYTLYDNSSGQKVWEGVQPTTVFYAATDAPYAGVAAQQDAQERAASQIATQIRLDLSRALARFWNPPQAAAAGAKP